MMKYLFIYIIKFYQFCLSPLFGSNKCRYLPTCSEFFIECIKIHGVGKGFYLGLKRILSCHPIKFLGGGSGLDYVPKKKLKEKV